MLVLDASVVISLVGEDIHHERATDLVIGRSDEPFIMHPINMAEAFVGLVRIGELERVRMALDVIGVGQHSMDPEAPARLARLRAQTGLKLPDCCALDTAMQLTSPLATFDQKLATAATDFGLEVFGA